MHTLEEVQEYLAQVMNPQRVKQCYDLISNPASRVNTPDEQWVACEQEQEVKTVTNAIMEILNLSGLEQYARVTQKVMIVCKMFTDQGITHKPRIPFYVLVIDKLI